MIIRIICIAIGSLVRSVSRNLLPAGGLIYRVCPPPAGRNDGCWHRSELADAGCAAATAAALGKRSRCPVCVCVCVCVCLCVCLCLAGILLTFVRFDRCASVPMCGLMMSVTPCAMYCRRSGRIGQCAGRMHHSRLRSVRAMLSRGRGWRDRVLLHHNDVR